jgi:single-strand DNA-binding protein
MPRSVNKVILVGNVGKDPEVRYSASGTPVANFSLATNEKFKDRNDQWQERTEWHSIVAWKRLAEIVGEYGAKGSKLRGGKDSDLKLGGPAERGEEIPQPPNPA